MKAVRWIRRLAAIGSESSKTSGLRCPAIILRSVLSAAFLFMFVGPLVFCANDNLEFITLGTDCDKIRVINQLVQGANVDSIDVDGQTALMRAAVSYNSACSEIVKILLDRGADVYAKDNSGLTALMMASREDNSEIVKILLDRGANVNDKDNSGLTALMMASILGHSETVRILLDKGADVNAKTSDGYTALMMASHGGYSEIVQLLKKAGAKE